ncbi:hypothetical protein [Mesorhizobium sp.]|nr:hypothetical protein [Mesorhizobium sp.]
MPHMTLTDRLAPTALLHYVLKLWLELQSWDFGQLYRSRQHHIITI